MEIFENLCAAFFLKTPLYKSLVFCFYDFAMYSSLISSLRLKTVLKLLEPALQIGIKAQLNLSITNIFKFLPLAFLSLHKSFLHQVFSGFHLELY